MVNGTNIVKGVLFFITAIFFTIISFYIVPVIIYEMDSFTGGNALLKTLFWSGYLIILILADIVAPAMIIMGATTNKQE